MTFYRYMMRNHKGEFSAAGDLADDMARDDKFPKNTMAKKRKDWYLIIRNHLLMAGACSACLEVFDKCWDEYAMQVGMPLSHKEYEEDDEDEEYEDKDFSWLVF